MRVGVIDYGVGNLGSVLRALEQLRVQPILVQRAVDVGTNDCLILPGVGNFGDCIQRLNDGGWVNSLHRAVREEGTRLLGVCVGMQLLADASSEGSLEERVDTPGLGLIPGKVEHLSRLGCTLRVPHVGWNGLHPARADKLLDGIPEGTDFYFVHSYAFVPKDPTHILAITDYDIPVCAVVRSGHVWGTQFHPEKSSRAGLRILRNFIMESPC